MGVPAVYSNASGAAVAPPSGYSAPGFPGQNQAFADLYYNRYRDYDSGTGRYIQADPIGLDGGASPYSYAMNNPLRYTDPTGEFVPILAGAAFGAGVEYLTNPCATGGDILLAGALGGLGGGGLGIGLKALGRGGKAARRFNPFKGKSRKQIADMLKKKGFEPKGPDPLNGEGTFVSPKRGSRNQFGGRGYHIDASHGPPKGPHVGVDRRRDFRDNHETRDFPL